MLGLRLRLTCTAHRFRGLVAARGTLSRYPQPQLQLQPQHSTFLSPNSQHIRFFHQSSVSPAPSSPLSTRPSVLSRLLSPLSSNPDSVPPTSTSFRKIVALARPERRPLLTAIGLLLVSSSVSLSIPFTVGKLIDYFTSPSPVGWSLLRAAIFKWEGQCLIRPDSQTIPYGLSLTQATAGLLLVFTIGGACNAGRAFLIRMSGAFCPFL
jgi:hypothetical protein